MALDLIAELEAIIVAFEQAGIGGAESLSPGREDDRRRVPRWTCYNEATSGSPAG
jgi:hypothetical protein